MQSAAARRRVQRRGTAITTAASVAARNAITEASRGRRLARESEARLAGVSITDGRIAFTRTRRVGELGGEHLGQPDDGGLRDRVGGRARAAGDPRAGRRR